MKALLQQRWCQKHSKQATHTTLKLGCSPPFFQLLIYVIKLRDSQLHFSAITRVVNRRTGAGMEPRWDPPVRNGIGERSQLVKKVYTGKKFEEGAVLSWPWAGLFYSLWSQHNCMLILGCFLRVYHPSEKLGTFWKAFQSLPGSQTEGD